MVSIRKRVPGGEQDVHGEKNPWKLGKDQKDLDTKEVRDA